jgi:hypothetical protein
LWRHDYVLGCPLSGCHGAASTLKPDEIGLLQGGHMKLDDFFRFYGVYRRAGNPILVSVRLARNRVFGHSF